MRTPLPRMSRRGRVTLIVLALVVVLFMFLGWLVDAWTDWLWFSEAHYTAVFTTVLWTRVGLFLIFGAFVALVVWFNLWLAYRLRPLLRPHSAEQQSLDRYRMLLTPRFPVWIGLLAGFIGLFAGLSAQDRWSLWLLFENRQSFGKTDPQFGLDISFYVFDYPFWRYLIGVGFTAVVLCVLGCLAVHYLFGGVRLQGAGERMTTAARAHLTALVAIFVLFKAVAYFLDQRGLLLSHNGATNLDGAGYTDINALLPAKEILAWISVVVAVAIIVFSNAFMRNLLWPGISVGLLVLSAIAIGGIYPAAVQTFSVKPNLRDKEQTYIQRSIDATRDAFGLSGADPTTYQTTSSVPPTGLADDTDTVANIRVLDPSVVASSYTQLQQSRGFYDFGPKLDIDRYTVSGKLQDYVVGVRELDYSNLSVQQKNWQNQHTVFTHGYGFVAAPANTTVCEGQPYFVAGFLDTQQSQQGSCTSNTDQIPVGQPDVYFGEYMDQGDGYAIVGKSADGRDAEYERSGNSGDQYTTYEGSGGVSVGSYWRRVLYAYKYKETNFLISNVFNNNSKILYVRDPYNRVKKVAPFLTLDSDPYPAVVGGKLMWIVDGYTTADTYPYSTQEDMRAATSDSLSTVESVTTQAQQNVNYLRNSVKATVDAYTGEVKLYSFDDSDPVLKAWNKAFGGHVILPSSAIPADLQAHFRYPEDQFKVQRDLLTRFHVTDARQFYSGQDFWDVPPDPAPSNSGSTKQAPYYLLAKFPGQSQSTFQLTAAMTPRNRQNLGALVTGSYVDGKPRLQILQISNSSVTVWGPKQADTKMTTDNNVRTAITLNTGSGTSTNGGSNAANLIYGNLLSLPVGGGMLYVEPLYIQNQGGSYPRLQFVVVNFGEYVGFGPTLQAAITSLLNSAASGNTSSSNSGGNTGGTNSGSSSGTQGGSPAVNAAVQKINKALQDLQAAKQANNFTDYGKALDALNQAIAEYQAAVAAAGANPSPSGTPSASATPSGSPPASATPSPSTG